MKKHTINDEIDLALLGLKDMRIDSDEYTIAAKNLKILCEASKERLPIDLNVLLTGVFTIIEIAVILNHERLNVISTKALGFINRFK